MLKKFFVKSNFNSPLNLFRRLKFILNLKAIAFYLKNINQTAKKIDALKKLESFEFFLPRRSTNLIKCNVLINLKKKKEKYTWKSNEMNEIRTKEWRKKHGYLSISRNFQVGQSLSGYHDLSQSERDFCISWLCQVTRAPQKELIPTAFTVRGKKVVFARVAYEERTLPWREN